MPKKISKNNVSGTTRRRYLEGKVVVPTLYDGNAVGRGSFMAGMVDDQLVMDPKTGRPMPLKEIGSVS